MSLRNLLLQLSILDPRRYMATTCGHRTKRAGYITAFGQTVAMRVPKNEGDSVDYCIHCIGEMTIQCAYCDEPIFIGDPIVLYLPDSDSEIPEHAVIYADLPLQLIGCLRYNCAETGMARAGFWVPGDNGKGRVLRVPNIYEALFGPTEPSVMVVDDVFDMKESINRNLSELRSRKAKQRDT